MKKFLIGFTGLLIIAIVAILLFFISDSNNPYVETSWGKFKGECSPVDQPDENYGNKMKYLLGKIAPLDNCKKIVMSQLVPFPGLPIETELVESGVLPRLTTFGDWNHPAVDSVTTVTKTAQMDNQSYTSYIDSIYNP